jgi:hypothetical protein
MLTLIITTAFPHAHRAEPTGFAREDTDVVSYTEVGLSRKQAFSPVTVKQVSASSTRVPAHRIDSI